jgi:hypothetical protein
MSAQTTGEKHICGLVWQISLQAKKLDKKKARKKRMS